MGTQVIPYPSPWPDRLACDQCQCEIAYMNGWITEVTGNQGHPQAIDEPDLRRDDDCECRCHDAWKRLRMVAW
jgi:hypothetical protein